MIKRFILTVMLCTILMFILGSCLTPWHPPHVDPQYLKHQAEIQSFKILPVNQRLDAYFKKYPDAFYELLGPCGNPQMAVDTDIEELLKGESTKTLINLLEHKSPNVRGVAVGLIRRKSGNTIEIVKKAYEKGNARIRFELFDFVKGLVIMGPAVPQVHYAKGTHDDFEKYGPERGKILDEIIADKNLPVFSTDIPRFRIHKYPPQAKDFPFDVIGFYIKFMGSDYILYKGEAIEALGGFRADASRAVPALIKILDEKDVDYGNSYLGGFYHRSGNYTLHCAAIIALGNIGPASKEAIPLILTAQNDANQVMQIYATTSLYLIGHEPEKNFQVLMNIINNEKSEDMLQLVISEFGRIGPPAKEALPKLYELARNDSERVRWSVFQSIYQIEGNNDNVQKLKIANIKHKNPKVRVETINDLDRYQMTEDVLSSIDGALNDPDPNVKFAACKVLSRHNGDKQKIIQALKEACDANPPMKCSSDFFSLVKTYGSAAKPLASSMPNLIVDDNAGYFREIADTTAAIGGDYEPCVKRIAEMAFKGNKNTQYSSFEALRGFKEKAVSAIPILYESKNKTSEEDSNVCRVLVQIVSGITPETKVSAEDLLKIMDCDNYEMIETDFNALMKINADPHLIAKRLVEIAGTKDYHFADRALEKLGELGYKAGNVIPDVTELYNRKDGAVSYEAKEATKKILKSVPEGEKIDAESLLKILDSDNDELYKVAIPVILANGGNAEMVIQKLISNIESGDYSLSQASVRGFYALGDESFKAIPRLCEVVKTKPDKVKSEAQSAIDQVIATLKPGKNYPMDVLLQALNCCRGQDGFHLAKRIIEVTGDRQAVFNHLANMVVSQDKNTFNNGGWALSLFKSDAVDALPMLLKQQPKINTNSEMHNVVSNILADIKPETKVSLDVLLDCMGTGDLGPATYAFLAYQKKGGDTDKMVDKLIEFSKNNDRDISLEAVRLLEKLGKKAKKAVPILKSLPERDERYNEDLGFAIRAIDG